MSNTASCRFCHRRAGSATLNALQKEQCKFEAAESSIDIPFCFLQAAHISAELERYPPAIEAFEAAAKAAVDNNLLKYSAKGYLLNAGICQLCSECSRTVCRHLQVWGLLLQQLRLLEPPGASASLLHSGLHCVPAPDVTPQTLPLLLLDGCFYVQADWRPAGRAAIWSPPAAPAVTALGCLRELCLINPCSWQDGAH